MGDLGGDTVNSDRLAAFADAYAPAVLAAVVDLGPHLHGQSAQEYALDACLSMLDMIQAKGLQSIEHYGINSRGGAFRRTAETLGVEPTVTALQHYLGG